MESESKSEDKKLRGANLLTVSKVNEEWTRETGEDGFILLRTELDRGTGKGEKLCLRRAGAAKPEGRFCLTV